MKKVLSLVLSLALVLGSFSMAFAADTNAVKLGDIDKSANAEAIQVVNDLGIVTGYPDGTFKPTTAVTRAEYAAMITRALAIPESALAGYKTTAFKDTAGTSWAVPYLAFCASKGIMLGDGNGNAMPSKTITVNEAMTMALRALGYTNNSARLVGAWPANYVTLAQTTGLYDGVAAATVIDRASAAQVIYNALTVGLVQVATDGTTIDVKDTLNVAKTLLTAGLNCKVGTAKVVKGTEDSKINLGKYQGAYVIPYADKDGNIIAIGEVKSTSLTGKYTSASGIFKVGKVEYKLASDKAITASGVVITNANASDSSAAAKTIMTSATDEYTIAVKLDGKTVVDLYSVAKWNAPSASSVFETADLSATKLLNQSFVLDSDKNIDETSYVLLGVTSLKNIKADNVVYVYNYVGGDNNGKIAKIEVGTKTIEGRITEVNTDGDAVINGVAYGNADSAYTINVGDEVKAKLDYSSKLYDVKVVSASTDNYGVVVATRGGLNGFDPEVKLVNKAGEEKWYGLKTITMADVTNAANNKLVTFGLTKDGKVSSITNSSISAGAVYANQKLNKDRDLFGNKYVDANSVVFVQEGTDVVLKTVKDITADENITFSAVALNKAGGDTIKAIYVDKTYVGGSDSVYAVFSTKTNKWNTTEEKSLQYVEGFNAGKEFKAYVADGTSGISTTTASGLAGLYELKVDANGMITKATTTVTSHGAISGITVSAIKGDKVTSESDNAVYKLAANVVIYQLNDDKDAWTVSTSLNGLKYKKVDLVNTADKDKTMYDIVFVY